MIDVPERRRKDGRSLKHFRDGFPRLTRRSLLHEPLEASGESARGGKERTEGLPVG